MKIMIIVLGICLGCSIQLPAQEAEIFRVDSEEKVQDAIPADVRYRYDAFRTGNISYFNGNTSTAKLNLNILTNEMQFIDVKNDTLSLAEEHTIKRITVGEEVYYYDIRFGYLEVVEGYHPVQLAVNQEITMISSEKAGAYGQSSGVSSIKTVNTYTTTNSPVQNLTQKGDLLLTKKLTYYIIDQNNRCHRFRKSSVLKVFADHKKTIRKFMADESTNFNHVDDIKKLLKFCNDLLF